MRIQDLENRTGLDRATIRYYEREGLIRPIRTDNGYRDYSEEDAQQLLKIKLLRQLDLPLETIKALQQGNTTVTEAMEHQMRFLKQKADATLRASDICHEIWEAGVGYESLDAGFYLQLLCDTSKKVRFKENIQMQMHPIRRFVARHIDWIWVRLMLMWMVYTVIRIRPAQNFYTLLINVAAVVLTIFLEAALVYLFGTTPGKWVMGIGVESINGGRLTWEESLWRSKLVTQEGLGFRFPIWCQIRMYLGYKGYTEGSSLAWEEDSELHFKEWNLTRKICLVLVYLLLVAGICTVGLDYSYYPANRGSQLTMEEFIENYNGYAKAGDTINDLERPAVLEENGEFEVLSRIKADYLRENPIYTVNDDGIIERIDFVGQFAYDQEILEWIAMAFVAANRDVAFVDIANLKSGVVFQQEIGTPIWSGRTSGSFKIENVQINWRYEAMNDLVYFTAEIEQE